MIRMLATILIAACTLSAYPHEVRAAIADKAIYGQSAKYLDLGAIPEERREEGLTALQFALPHWSRAVVIDHQRPVRLPGTDLYRVDIDALGWTWRAWCEIAKAYPYGLFIDQHGTLCRDANPLIIRGDWLLRVTADTNESDVYYQLLYAGQKIPTTRAEFLKTWAVRLDDTFDLDAGTIIGPGGSGVANKHNFRLLRWAPTARGDFFETFDSANTSGENNPFENLPKGTRFDPPPFKFDAGEQIVTIPKVDIVSGKRGTAQAYFLTNGNGQRVDIAEGTIVTGADLFGVRQIRTPGSCFLCHGGLNGPKQNYMRDAIADGIELTTKDKRQQEFLERFYLSQLGQTIEAGNESFAAFVEMACGPGVAPGDAVADWQRTVESFDAPLSLEQAALETACGPDELRNAIAYYSERIGPQKGVGLLSGLAHDRELDRDSWENGNYGLALTALYVWRKRK